MKISVCEGNNFKAFFEDGQLTISRYLPNGNYESKSVMDAKEFVAVSTSFLQKLPIPDFEWVNAHVVETLELLGIVIETGQFRFYDEEEIQNILQELLVLLDKEC